MELAKSGDTIVARASEIKRNYRTGFYRIDILHKEKLIATMEAVSYRKDHYFVDLKTTRIKYYHRQVRK